MTKFRQLEEVSKFTALQVIPVEPAPVETTAAAEVDEASTMTVDVVGQAETLPEDFPETPPDPLYQLREEGPITYFQYYLDDTKQPGSSAPFIGTSARSNFLSPTLVGATVLTATALTGFFLANAATDKQVVKSPSDSKSSESRVKQSTSKGLSTTKPAVPEQIGQPEMRLAQKAPIPEISAIVSEPKLPPRSSVMEAQIAQALSQPPIAIAPPERFGFAPPPLPPAASSQSAAAQPPVQPPAQAQTPVLTPQPGEPGVSAPATAPIAEPTLPTAPAPQPLQPEVNPNLFPVQGTPGTEAETPLPTAVDPASEPDGTSSIAKPASIDEVKGASEPTPVPSSTQPSGSPQSIQDFVNLADDQSEMPLRLLTERAASEVLTTNRVGAFAVLKLSPNDYLNEWQVSSKTQIDANTSYALPAHGFIDYRRQVIAVLQDDTETLKSATTNPAPSAQTAPLTQPTAAPAARSGVLGGR
jgi:hypothetical protein